MIRIKFKFFLFTLLICSCSQSPQQAPKNIKDILPSEAAKNSTSTEVKYNDEYSNKEIKDGSFYLKDLSNTRFSKSKIYNSKFSKANLNNAQFMGAYIDNSDFQGARGFKSYIQDCEIVESEFSNSDFTRGGFIGTTMKDSRFDDCNFFRSWMTDMKATDCSFINAKFTSVVLKLTQFKKCDLNGAIFDRAIIDKDDFMKNINDRENKGLENFFEKYKITGPYDSLGYFSNYHRIEKLR